jgi:putative flippase GtrA
MALARLGASVFNLALNRQFVFRSTAQLPGILIRYYGLVAFVGSVAYVLIRFLNETFGMAIPLAKILVETGLFLISFVAHRDFVFAAPAEAGEPEKAGSPGD